MHVDQSPKRPYYAASSEEVGEALSKVNIKPSTFIYNEILQKHRLPMLWYIGQFDTQDGVAGHEDILKLLKWDKEK